MIHKTTDAAEAYKTGRQGTKVGYTPPTASLVSYTFACGVMYVATQRLDAVRDELCVRFIMRHFFSSYSSACEVTHQICRCYPSLGNHLDLAPTSHAYQ